MNNANQNKQVSSSSKKKPETGKSKGSSANISVSKGSNAKSSSLLSKKVSVKQVIIIVLVAVLGLGAVGGGAYLITQSSNNKVEQEEDENEEDVNESEEDTEEDGGEEDTEADRNTDDSEEEDDDEQSQEDEWANVQMKTCSHDELKASMDIPQSWDCEELNEYVLRTAGDGFTLDISNVGRGATCSPEMEERNSDVCSRLYSNDQFTIYMNAIEGENQEIFGILLEEAGIYLSGTYDNMQQRDLTSAEKDLLVKIFESIEIAYNPPPAYKHTYETQAYPYDPDPDEYVGFQHCDMKESVCYVYGVKRSKIPLEVVVGEEYVLKFNECVGGGAAAGTTYCKVEGKVKVRKK